MAQSTLANIKSSAAATARVKSKRADIQGLRAIAVLAVIFDHLVHWPSGGFVGVDVFFVISGFLITGILLKEHDRTGTISFSGFYRRRVKRIMPAAVVTLAVTAALSFLLFNAGRAQQTLDDSIWGLFFSANWHFASVGTDYFQASGPTSPLQHFWSLAVEEQFYFVWPWLMLLIFWLGGRSTVWDKLKARKSIGFAMLAIVALSFIWAMFQSTAEPTIAYFSTFTRAWELGIGALLAVFATAFRHIPAWLRPVLGWIGVAGIFWSIFSITSAMPFPAPWAAAPVLATALVIAAGTGGEQRFMWPLTNRATGYVGSISYSLYLWHFPVVILLGSLIQEDSPLFVPVAVVLMAGFSVASFHLVEEPARKSIWLDNSRAAKAIRRQREYTRIEIRRSTQFIVIGILAVLALGVAGYALFIPRTPAATALPAPAVIPTAGAAAPTPLQVRGASVQAALDSTAWPKLTPDLGSLEKGRSNVSCELGPNDALPSDADVLSKCLNGDKNAPKTAVLLGDSYAAALSPGLIDALAPKGYKVVVLTKNSCPAVKIAVVLQGGAAYPGCTDFQNFTAAQVAKLAPDMLIISGWHGQVIDRLADGSRGPAALSEWQAATQASLTDFAKTAKQVFVVAGPPTGRNLQECATPLSHPSDCVAPVPGEYKTFSTAEQTAVAAVNSKTVRYVPVLDWFCAADRCPGYIGSNPVYVDGGHLTNPAAKLLAPLLQSALLS
jgi:peptidoglycan/LPS O-acetylase OafA/YrhL